MIASSFSTKQVCTFFFKPLLDEQDEPTCFFRCQCLVVRKQEPKTGFSNLISHIRQQHPNYVADMAASGTASGTLTAFVDKKSLNVYGWIDFVVNCGLPFAFPEHATARKYTSLAPICTETLLKFGIIFDGRTLQSEHYLCVFDCFAHDNHTETILLAMAPLIDDSVEDHTASAHVTFLTSILTFFKRSVADVLYVVADNCSTNGRVAALLNVPLVGCASHCLNLAAKTFMSEWETILDKVQALMCKLRGRMLRRCSENQAASGSSSNYVLEQFFEIKGAIDTDDDAIAELMPTKREENKLQDLLEQLKNFESASKKLQSEDGVSLLDVRDIFDELIELHPTLTTSLGAQAKIVKSPVFESACVEVLMRKVTELTRARRTALTAFAVDGNTEVDPEDTKLGFADKVLKKRKTARQQRKEYPGVEFIPPTSNACERFFSQVKHVLGDCRTGMLPIHLEMELFLKANRRFWDAKTVMKVVNVNK